MIPIEMVRAAAPDLKTYWIHKAFAAQDFDDVAVLRTALFEWLQHVGGYIPEAVWADLVDWVTPTLAQVAKDMGVSSHSALLAVADGHWLLVPDREDWYDLEQAQWVPAMPYAPVTYLTCDLRALWARFSARLEHAVRMRGHEHADQPNQ